MVSDPTFNHSHPKLVAPAPLKAVRLLLAAKQPTIKRNGAAFTRKGLPPKLQDRDDEDKENVEKVRAEMMCFAGGEDGGNEDMNEGLNLSKGNLWLTDRTHADQAAHAELLEIISRASRLPDRYDPGSPYCWPSRQSFPAPPKVEVVPRARSCLDRGVEVCNRKRRRVSRLWKEDKRVVDEEGREDGDEVRYVEVEVVGRNSMVEGEDGGDLYEKPVELMCDYLVLGLPPPVVPASPILRTQNPMPLNSPFTQLTISEPKYNEPRQKGTRRPRKGIDPLSHHDADADADAETSKRSSWSTAMMQVLAVTRMRSLSVGDRPFGCLV